MHQKSRISLILLPCWTNFCPPLGLALLAGTLKKNNYETCCFDFNIQAWANSPEEYKAFWDFSKHFLWNNLANFEQLVLPKIQSQLDHYLNELVNYSPTVVGLSIFDTNVHTTLYFAKKIKETIPNVKIICGGPGCQNADKETSPFNTAYKKFIDFIILGEGEERFITVLQQITIATQNTKIPGVLTQVDGRFIHGGIATTSVDLNTLAYPDFSDFNLSLYRYPLLPILTSRGCVAKCAFCGETQFFKGYRFRSAENILGEIKQNINTYHINNFAFNDSLINGKITELEKLADLIINENIDIRWGGYARVHKGLTLPLLKKLKLAGCYYLSFGIESGSQKIINDMQKGFTIKTAEKNLRDCTMSGLEAHVNWIIGFPTETTLDFIASLFFVFKNRKNIAVLNPGQTPCGIPENSDLNKHREYYGIAPETFAGDWATFDHKNTVIVRKKRLLFFVWWLDLLHIHHS